MEIIHRCCCGIDVHAKSLVGCLIKQGKKQIRTYSTMTDDLLAMLRALSRGEEDAAKMAALARGRLQTKQGQLQRALRGKLTRSQRFVLRELLDQLEQLEAAVARVSAEIREQIEEKSDPFC